MQVPRMNTQVCAVTVAYNSPEELERLLASLTDQGDSLNGLVVIDNSDVACLAANKKTFDSYSSRYVFSRYRATGENVGSAGGFRRGMEISHKNGFDWVWLLDQDGAVSPGCLAQCLSHSGEGDILCPNIVDIDQPDVTVPWVYTENFLGRCYPATSCSTGCQICEFGTHATLISKRALDTIGYYDDCFFFVGWEDSDYALRARQAGLTINYVRRAEARHPKQGLNRAERALNSLLLNELQHVKNRERTLWSRGTAVLNGKERSRLWAIKILQLIIQIPILFPEYLGYITDLEAQETLCSRTESITIFSRAYIVSKRVKPWQFQIALAYSICLGLCLKILWHRGIGLKMTLRLYVTCLAHRLKNDWPYTCIEQLCREVVQGHQ